MHRSWPISTLLPLFLFKYIFRTQILSCRFLLLHSYPEQKKSVFAGRGLNIRMAIYNPHGISMCHQGEHIDKEQCWLRWGSLCMETASPCNRPHCRLQIPRMHRPMGYISTYTHTDIHTHTQAHTHTIGPLWGVHVCRLLLHSILGVFL